MRQLLVLVTVVTLLTLSEGTEMSVSGLGMEANDTLGSNMFEMAKEGDEENSIKFGFYKFVELDTEGNPIDAEKHVCEFDKAAEAIECTAGGVTKGEWPGLNDTGVERNIPYSLVARECSLSSCNANTESKIKISTYIFEDDGYICQPDCSSDTAEQSKVFNGTAKWTIEVSDWEFCTADSTECNEKVGEKMKIYFNVQGKRKGKPSKPTKKERKAFNVTACEEEMAKGKGKGDKGKGKGDKGEEETEETDPTRRRREAEEGGAKKTKGRCKPSRGTSFNGQPEDQENFSFGGDEDDEDGDGEGAMSFRLFPSAILDEGEVGQRTVTIEAGDFEGPSVELLTESVGSSGKTREVAYVTIVVPKFDKNLWYDPTGDVSSSGGTTVPEDDTSGSYSITHTPSLVLLLLSLVPLLR